MASKLGRVQNKKPSTSKQLTELEERLNQLAQAVEVALNNMNQQLSTSVEILNAIVGHLGEEKVIELIKENRKKADLERIEKTKEQLKAMASSGLLVKADEVGEESLIIGKESDKDGNVIHPGWVSVGFKDVKPEFKELLKGKKAGDVFETPVGKFEVLEVWNFGTPTDTKSDNQSDNQ